MCWSYSYSQNVVDGKRLWFLYLSFVVCVCLCLLIWQSSPKNCSAQSEKNQLSADKRLKPANDMSQFDLIFSICIPHSMSVGNQIAFVSSTDNWQFSRVDGTTTCLIFPFDVLILFVYISLQLFLARYCTLVAVLLPKHAHTTRAVERSWHKHLSINECISKNTVLRIAFTRTERWVAIFNLLHMWPSVCAVDLGLFEIRKFQFNVCTSNMF